ncbi:hypothetical protein CsatB_023639 [Cannabis sativa]
MHSVENEQGNLFFINGHGGTGKTFLWNTIIAKLRSQSKIVLHVATSRISALLLPNGKTTHSRFHISLDVTAESTCEIRQGTLLAKLLMKTSLIIWDETPMIGDGSLYDDIDRELIKLPSDICKNLSQDPVKFIVEAIYPSLLQNYNDPAYLKERAILTPINKMVHGLNEMIMNIIPDEERIYYSSDTICKANIRTSDDDLLYPPEFLHSLKFNAIPNHDIRLKEGVPVMLLRNLNQTEGLCNNTRLIVTHLRKWSIRAYIISGTNIGENVTIPRIIMSPNKLKWSLKLNRRQLSLAPCFAMTIYKVKYNLLNMLIISP